MSYYSYHSIKRAEERANMKPAGARKMIDRAIEYGQSPWDLPSDERNYLIAREYNGCRCVYNEGFCFILGENDTCVTLFKAPKWFGKTNRFDGKVRIKKIKKYYKMQKDFLVG